MTQGPEMDEAALVAAARAGDPAAFARLCEIHRGLLSSRIQRFLQGPLRRRVSVQDVMQDAYVVAHLRLAEFEARGPGAFGAWLAQIAELKAREAMRRHAGSRKRGIGREVAVGSTGVDAEPAGGVTSPSQAAMGTETAAAIERAFARLPPDYRHVLDLVQRRHTSLRDAAVVLDRSYEATKKLFARALARLAAEMDPSPDPVDRGP
jgi:RNA polymerase sigma-70 factor (ECF subfamily)